MSRGPGGAGRGSPRRTRTDEPERLGDVLKGLRAGEALAGGLLLGELGRRWGEVVGDRLAQESSPAVLRGGVLIVQASTSAWAAQLRFLADELRKRVNGALPGSPVREIRITVGGRGGPS